MTLEQINHEQDVRISKNSITVKRDGKTAGIVRNVTNFMDLQPNKSMDFFKKIRKYEMQNNKIRRSNCYIYDGELYYIFKKPCAVMEDAKEKHMELLQLLTEMEKDMHVLYIGAETRYY